MQENYRGADASVDALLEKEIRSAAERVIDEILANTSLQSGDIFVVGCSSSEILGSKIGKGSSFEAARIVFDVIYPKLCERGIFLAAQCCEHLNRALVIESQCAEKYGYEAVAVKPQPKAGGSFATLTYENMDAPVVVEHIRAHAGLDIGLTLIGMHLRDVAVPLRLSLNQIGEAKIVCAYTRPKFIGGSRAVY
jgi:uncharacterized protein (TIGR01440 family)